MVQMDRVGMCPDKRRQKPRRLDAQRGTQNRNNFAGINVQCQGEDRG